MEILLWSAVLAAAIYALVRASDFFTEAALEIGLAFELPAFVIGVTVVSVGTSLPELGSSVFAVLRGASEIVSGNVLGSNVANILLVIGASSFAAGRTVEMGDRSLRTDLLLLSAATLLFCLLVADGSFTFREAVVSLAAQAAYLVYIVRRGKDSAVALPAGDELEVVEKAGQRKVRFRTVAVLAVSGAAIYLGARFTVDAIVRLSELLGLGSEVIAASAVAIGTSLPELAVSVSAARKGEFEVAVGNVVGSNIFNSLAVMGLPALFGILTVPGGIILPGLPLLAAATLVLILIIADHRINRLEGGLMLGLYVLFLVMIFDVL